MQATRLIIITVILAAAAAPVFAAPTLGCASGSTQFVTINNDLYDSDLLKQNKPYAMTETTINVMYYQPDGSFCWGPVQTSFESAPATVCGGGDNGCSKGIAQVRIYPSQVLDNTNWGVDKNNNPYTNYVYSGTSQSPYVISIDPTQRYTTFNIIQDPSKPGPTFDPATGMAITQGSMTKSATSYAAPAGMNY